MIKVGLTGNIGSGKSTIAMVFESFGVPVFHADDESKKFLSEPTVVEELANVFGHQILDGQSINRKKLASIVFNDRKELESLNSIIHPRVRQALMNWIESKQDCKYIVQEAAILFESGFYKFFDKNIVVSCPEEIAVKRVMDRDGASEKDIKARIQNQWLEKDKIPLADFIIVNDGNQMILPQILDIHKSLIK